MKIKALIIATSIVLLSGCGGGGSETPTNPATETPLEFSISSLSYNNGSIIAKEHICSSYGGDDKSPQYSWANEPTATTSYALIMDDETSPCGTGDNACKHWAVFNIPSTVAQVDENVAITSIGTGVTEGLAYNSETDYAGPCPPSNHTYNTTIYALKTGMPTVAASTALTRSEFSTTYADYIIDSATMTGTRSPTDSPDPEFTSASTASVDENQTAAITLVASSDSAITYSISGADFALFNIDSSTGVVTFVSAPDFETELDIGADSIYNFTATAADTFGNTATQNVVITVTDITDETAPVFTSNAAVNAAENQTAVITLAVTDATPVVYSISSADFALFNIDSSTGVVTFVSAPDFETKLDIGTDNIYNFTATATDVAENATTQSVAITVTDVNEFTGGEWAVADGGDGLTYNLITSPDTQRVWLDRNLGATQVAISSGDTDSFGDYYQWGRARDGHQLIGSATHGTQLDDISTVSDKFILYHDDWTSTDDYGPLRNIAWANDGDNDICPPFFSVPTEDEMQADTIDATTTAISSPSTAFDSFLKLPMNGFRRSDDVENTSHGAMTDLWTRTPHHFDAAIRFHTSATGTYLNSVDKTMGTGVRCIQDLIEQ